MPTPPRARSEADILIESLPYLRYPSEKFKKLFTMTVTNLCQDFTDASYIPRNGSEEINEDNPVAVFTQPSIDMLRSHIEDIVALEDASVEEEIKDNIQPDLVEEIIEDIEVEEIIDEKDDLVIPVDEPDDEDIS